MYVSVLRRFMVCVGLCVLLGVCVLYRDPVQQSLQVLRQLTEMQRSLQEALQRAGETLIITSCEYRHKHRWTQLFPPTAQVRSVKCMFMYLPCVSSVLFYCGVKVQSDGKERREMAEN